MYADSIMPLMKEEARYDLIYELINQGKNAEEISVIINGNTNLHSKEDRRGDSSEEIANYRLNNLSIVQHTIRYPRHSKQDRKGCDIEVTFHKKELTRLIGGEPSIKNCRVQVKSSHKGIKAFRRKFGNTREERDLNMAQQKTTLVNARWEESHFNKSFIQQVKLINNFHQKDE